MLGASQISATTQGFNYLIRDKAVSLGKIKQRILLANEFSHSTWRATNRLIEPT